MRHTKCEYNIAGKSYLPKTRKIRFKSFWSKGTSTPLVNDIGMMSYFKHNESITLKVSFIYSTIDTR